MTAGVIPPSQVTASHVVCPQCGFKRRSGKLSCCSSGGAWYKNCADRVDSNFDHTWIEGIEACKHVASSQIKQRYDEINLNATETQIASNRQTTNFLAGLESNVSDTGISIDLEAIATFASFSLILINPFTIRE